MNHAYKVPEGEFMIQKTYMANEGNIQREWVLVDAAGMPLGRLVAQVAMILRGKHKPTYTPHADAGDYVVVINSDKIVLTGKKMTDKIYWSHSGYIGGAKEVQAKEMLKNKSDFMIERAVKGMLPKNALGRQMFRKLKVYKEEIKTTAAAKAEVKTEAATHSQSEPSKDIRIKKSGASIKMNGTNATGRRKKSIARVRIISGGSGKVIINDQPLDTYFVSGFLKLIVNQPLKTANVSNIDVIVSVHGGGLTGQAGAIRHGIARALIKEDAQLKPELKKAGYLKRDPRMKERKKYGLKKARRAPPQFSKR
ncbi:ribosomal protein l13 [Holotrichia oblita]|nr:ribosomal protein l13 [Holotrichia oblita]